MKFMQNGQILGPNLVDFLPGKKANFFRFCNYFCRKIGMQISISIAIDSMRNKYYCAEWDISERKGR